MSRKFQPPLALIWGLSIFGVWTFLAFQLAQPIWKMQSSQELAAYGAFKGRDLSFGNGWRVFASQWLHVKFPHMSLNGVMIALLGTALQQRTSAGVVLLVGLGGGAIGQYVSALAYPTAFISGASQAYLALAGAVIVLLDRKRTAWWTAIAGTAAAIVIDVLVSSHGAIKIGHTTAFGAGVVSAAIILAVERMKFQKSASLKDGCGVTLSSRKD